MYQATHHKKPDQTPTPPLAANDRLAKVLHAANELSKSRLREIKSRNETRWNEIERTNKSKLVQQHKPWTKATGPRTDAGKKIARMNAFKHGRRGARLRMIHKVLSAQSAFRRQILLRIKIDNASGPDAPFIRAHAAFRMEFLARKQISCLNDALHMLDSLEKVNDSCPIQCLLKTMIRLPSFPPPRFLPI